MCVRGCDRSKKAERRVTWGVQVLRSPNLFKKNYSPQEDENAVISQRIHPVDINIFPNAHATIAWPQQTLLQETLELEPPRIFKEEETILHTIKRRKSNWIGHIMCRNCFLNTLIKVRLKRRKDKEEDVSSYRTILGTREYTRIRERKHQIALREELVLKKLRTCRKKDQAVNRVPTLRCMLVAYAKY